MAAPSIRTLLLKMLPGFLPLIIYVVAESVWGETVGLITGISCGVVEFAVIIIRTRQPDWMALFDTLLLAAMGGISLALHDDIFFKIKPAVVEAVFTILIGVSAFGSRNLLMGRTMKSMAAQGIDLAPAEARMQGMMKGLFAVLVLHVLLTLAAAFWWSKEAWLFVTSGLFFILVGIWAAGVFGRLFWQIRTLRKAARPPGNPGAIT